MPAIPPNVTPIDDLKDSKSSGAFDATLNQSQGEVASIFASQTSSIGATAGVWNVSGQFEGRYDTATNPGGAVVASSTMFFDFTLDRARTVSLTASGTFLDIHGPNGGDAGGFGLNIGGDNPGVSFDTGSGGNTGQIVSKSITKSFDLPAGKYFLSAFAGADNDDPGILKGSGSLTFKLTATEIGSTPSPIPLPPAAIPAGLTLLGMASLAVRRCYRDEILAP